jgi:hypothetical protein
VRTLQTERSASDADDDPTALKMPPTARFADLGHVGLTSDSHPSEVWLRWWTAFEKYGSDLQRGTRAFFVKGNGTRWDAEGLICAKLRRYYFVSPNTASLRMWTSS